MNDRQGTTFYILSFTTTEYTNPPDRLETKVRHDFATTRSMISSVRLEPVLYVYLLPQYR